MSIFDRIIGKKEKEFKLQSSEQFESMVVTGAKRKVSTFADLFLPRINPAHLEALYHQDEIIFNGINLYSSIFLSADYEILSDNDKNTQLISSFLKINDFPYILQRIVQDLCIYGNAWMELISNEDDKFTNIVMLDPKCFDVRRTFMQKPDFDEYGFPVSYVQYLDYNAKLPPEAKEIQQNDLWGNYSRAIEIPTDKLAHFTLYTAGNDPLGIGYIEPMYNVTKAKHTTRQGISQFVGRAGFPLYGFKVGDKDHQPTPQQLQDLYEKTQDINERTTFVHAYWVEPYVLESKHAVQVQEHITQYEEAQIATLGIPKALVTGMGEETNRATLERQIYIWEKRMRLIQYRIANTLESEVFRRLVHNSNSKIIFSDISTESIFGRVERWTNLAKAGLVASDKPLRQYIRKTEHLPEEEENTEPKQNERPG